MVERLAPAAGAWDLWFHSVDRRSRSDYEFCVDPERACPDKYNIFSGKLPFQHLEPPYDLSAAELERIQPILRHYDRHWCGDDPEIVAYPWNWFALPL